MQAQDFLGIARRFFDRTLRFQVYTSVNDGTKSPV